MTMSIPRPEYPRPQFVREDWINLNGEWEFAFDDERKGVAKQWPSGRVPLSSKIQVPFAFQSKLSGIGDPDFHDCVWYRKTFALPETFKGKRVLLHFGAVDYEADVWVNGTLAVRHEGGHTPFSADITDLLQEQDNVIVVKAVDDSRDLTIPRGKQYWEKDSASIFYTRTTGIWQTVWLEAVPEVYLKQVKFTPDLDRHSVGMQWFVAGPLQGKDIQLKAEIFFKGELVAEDVYRVTKPSGMRWVRLQDAGDLAFYRLWSPENPNLYDVTFTLLQDAQAVDRVKSYFGMRKISVENGKVCLNNRPYYMKLVLDQGYFPDGNLTPPSDEAIRQDVELAKAMGFNGVRKHQKLEDPRFLYWCDRLGLLVWGEMPSAYEFSDDYVRRLTREWQEAVERDYNHPCIVVWVPLNESWGVPKIQNDAQQQHHAMALYYLTKTLDPTRLVVSNDGWEMVKTDLLNIHDYEWREEVLRERYHSVESALQSMPANRQLIVGGCSYEGQPILVTEFGGIAYKKSEWEGWGYSGAENDEDFERRLRAVVAPLLASRAVQGYCYTQLTDVEQEINGLLTYDRKPKLPLETIKGIFEGRS